MLIHARSHDSPNIGVETPPHQHGKALIFSLAR
jgi:hypothetical protein